MSAIKRRFILGFTLLEIMVVVVITGIIAAFAIPNYTKSIQKAHERDIVAQLSTIHAANMLYRSYAGEYWNTGGTIVDLAAINSNLSLSIIANGATYIYHGEGPTFTAKGDWGTCNIGVSEVPIGANNPCVDSGTCVLPLVACP